MPWSAANCASASIPAPKAGHWAAGSTGLSFTAVSSAPWTAFEVSQTMMTRDPTAMSRSRKGCIAAFSASTVFTSRLVECQPET